MKIGEQLNLTDGKGTLLTCEISADNKKHCSVVPQKIVYQQQATNKVSIAISLLKNNNRFEWFLEKATELGVSEIVPLICGRTEKEKFRSDRLKGICISAMLQSQQTWLPILHEPANYTNYLRSFNEKDQQKFIAHCVDSVSKRDLLSCKPFHSPAILIGPEGDFTLEEIDLAYQTGFIPVSLGTKRLRTETAGITAAVLLTSI
jgi:16S rRNA (uracil1498-N3)-methyltransferase